MALVRYSGDQPTIKPEPRKESSDFLQQLLFADNQLLMTSVIIRDLDVANNLFNPIEHRLDEVTPLLVRRGSNSTVSSEDVSLGAGSEETVDSENGEIPIKHLSRCFSLICTDPDGKEHPHEGIVAALDVTDRGFIFDNEHRTLVDTFAKLDTFLSLLTNLPPSRLDRPQVAMDCEGRSLGRYGSLTLLQIFLHFMAHTYVLDILTLGGRKAFDYEHENGWSVRRFSESPDILKIFWDPRQDQDALKAHFGVELGWTMCLQLVELVVRDRGRDREYRTRLSRCIDLEGNAWMSTEDVDKWVLANVAGRSYFNRFGYEVFEQRPMPPVALEYAAGDVDQMLQLWDHFYPRLTAEGNELVAVETKKCLLESMRPDKPEGSGIAPQSIQDLPIIPFVFEEYTGQGFDSDDTFAEEDAALTEDSDSWPEEDDQPDWEKEALKHVEYNWSGVTLTTTANNRASTDNFFGDRK